MGQVASIEIEAAKAFDMHDYVKSLKLYKELFRQSRSLANSNLKTHSQIQIAYIFTLQRSLEKADQWLDSCKSSLIDNPTDTLNIIDYSFVHGLNEFEKFDYKQAIIDFENSRHFASHYYGKTHWLVARSLMQISIIYKDAYYLNEVAIDYSTRAIQILNRSNDHEELLALCNYQMARIHHSARNWDQSELYNIRAKEFFSRNPVIYFSELADIQHLDALIEFYQFGSNTKVLEKYLSAIKNLENRDKLIQKLGKYYDNYGFMLLQAGSVKEALYYFKKGLNHNLRQSFNEYWIASSYLNISTLYSMSNNYDSASYYLEKSLKYRIKLFGEIHPEVASIYLHIADIYDKAGDYHKAIDYCVKSLSSFRNGRDENHYGISSNYLMLHIYTFNKAAELSFKEFQLSNDIQFLNKAMSYSLRADSIATSNQTDGWERASISFQQELRPVYDCLLKIHFALLGQEPNEELSYRAFAIMDRIKHRSLVENSYRMANPLLNRGQRIIGQIRILEELLAMQNQEHILAINETLITLHEQYETFTDSIRKINKQPTAGFTSELPDSKLVKDLQKYLSKSNTDFLQCYEADSSFYFILLKGSSAKAFAVPKTFKQIEAIKWIFNLASQKPDLKTIGADKAEFISKSNSLYNSFLKNLIAPDHLNEIIISADGILNFLPFELLITTNNGDFKWNNMPYLLHDQVVSNAYSATHFIMKSNDPFSLNPKVLIIGSQKNGDIGGEVQTIKQLMDVEIMRNPTTAEFLSQTTRSSIIHIPLHGQTDSINYLRSMMFLPNQNHLDTLYAFELYDKHIPADLVVLGSCESGAGYYHSGEGVFSFARAFSFAGAKNVVMCLWKIPDYQTSLVLGSFYKHYSEKQRISLALNAAKKEYLFKSDELLAHPYFWSGVVPYVSAQPSQHRFKLIIALLLIGSLMVTATLIVSRKIK